MTPRKRKDTNWPVPLRNRSSSLGAAVREYAQSTEDSRAEAAVYARVLARVGGRSRRVPMLAAGFVITGVLATAVVALVVRHRVTDVSTSRVTVASNSAAPVSAPPHPSTSTEASLPEARSSRTAPAPRPPTASIRLAALPVSLPTGNVALVEQATAVLSADAVATGRAQAGDTEIVLSKGSIELHVDPRAPGHDFTVNAGLYRFTVVGTAFTVSQTRSRLQLLVSEGTVAVWRGTKRLATVGAGAEWSAEVSPAVSARPPALRWVGLRAWRRPGCAIRDNRLLRRAWPSPRAHAGVQREAAARLGLGRDRIPGCPNAHARPRSPARETRSVRGPSGDGDAPRRCCFHGSAPRRHPPASK